MLALAAGLGEEAAVLAERALVAFDAWGVAWDKRLRLERWRQLAELVARDGRTGDRELEVAVLGNDPGRLELYGYLDACDPVWADVTLLSVADRLATRGARSEEAIERHLELARSVIGEALAWQRHGRPPALVRGDQLAAALGVSPGPLLGELLAAIAEQAFTGELNSPQDAIAFAASRIA